MKAQKLIEGASFGPEQLMVIGKAFDDAWEQVAPGVRDNPGAHEAARIKLANNILRLSKDWVITDPEELAAEAVALMFEHPTELASKETASAKRGQL